MRRLIPLALILTALIAAPENGASASAQLTVDAFADSFDGSCGDGDCTLRDALATIGGGGTVILPPGFYALSLSGPGGIEEGDLDIAVSVTIEASGDSGAFVDASGIGERAFDIKGGEVELRGLTLFGSTIDGNGGVVRLGGKAPSVTLDHVTLTGGAARFGGAVYIKDGASLSASNSLFLDNRARDSGGAIAVDGELVVTRSALTGNRTRGNGGAIWTRDTGRSRILISTIARNRARADGGGLWFGAGGVIDRATIASNVAGGRGGGVRSLNPPGGDPTLETYVGRSILAGNEATKGRECSGHLVSLGRNVTRTSRCGFGVAGDVTAVDPLLGPLVSNGGPTPTMALRAGSPAIDLAGVGCAGKDQRGAPVERRCDAGAYERVLCLGRPVNIVGTPGDDELSGGRERDSFLGLGGHDEFQGSVGADVACGGAGDDRLIGGPDPDELLGQRGDDRLLGEEGNDVLRGGAGTDRCSGGPGRDRLFTCEG